MDNKKRLLSESNDSKCDDVTLHSDDFMQVPNVCISPDGSVATRLNNARGDVKTPSGKGRRAGGPGSLCSSSYAKASTSKSDATITSYGDESLRIELIAEETLKCSKRHTHHGKQ